MTESLQFFVVSVAGIALITMVLLLIKEILDLIAFREAMRLSSPRRSQVVFRQRHTLTRKLSVVVPSNLRAAQKFPGRTAGSAGRQCPIAAAPSI